MLDPIFECQFLILLKKKNVRFSFLFDGTICLIHSFPIVNQGNKYRLPILNSSDRQYQLMLTFGEKLAEQKRPNRKHLRNKSRIKISDIPLQTQTRAVVPNKNQKSFLNVFSRYVFRKKKEAAEIS